MTLDSAQERHGEENGVTPPAPQPFWGYQDLVLFLVLGIPSFVTAGILTLVFKHLVPGAPQGLHILPPQFIGYGLWFASLWFILKSRYNAPFWRSLDWHWSTGWEFAAATAGALLAVTVGFLGVLLRTPQIESPMEDLMEDPGSAILVAIFATTLGPVCEELAFRGFLLPLLVRSIGPVTGAILAAVPFALLHGPQNAWSWRHIVLILIAGTAFGWMRIRSGSTAACTIMHATYNLMFLVPFFVKDLI